MNAWQVPVSAHQGRVADRLAHWFEQSGDTTRLVTAACGLRANPGFAGAVEGERRCPRCVEALGGKE